MSEEEKPNKYAIMYVVTKYVAETVEANNPIEAKAHADAIVKSEYPGFDVSCVGKRNLTKNELYQEAKEDDDE